MKLIIWPDSCCYFVCAAAVDQTFYIHWIFLSEKAWTPILYVRNVFPVCACGQMVCLLNGVVHCVLPFHTFQEKFRSPSFLTSFVYKNTIHLLLATKKKNTEGGGKKKRKIRGKKVYIAIFPTHTHLSSKQVGVYHCIFSRGSKRIPPLLLSERREREEKTGGKYLVTKKCWM